MRSDPSSGGLHLPSHAQGRGGTYTTRSTSSSSSMSSQLPPSGGGLNLPPQGFSGSAGTRSVHSASNASSIPPPPPVTSTLQRGAYLQTAPGAQQFPGTMEGDDGTIIIGDGQSSVASVIAARPINSSYVSQEQITASVYRIPERDGEAPSAPVHRVNNSQHLLEKPTVKAELMGEEDKPRPFWKDWKVICCILFLFVLAIGLGVGFAIGLNGNASASLATTTNSPGQVAITSAPSSSPTLEFSSPDSATCETVGKGWEVKNQDFMIEKMFSLDLDVIVVDQVQSIAPFLDEIEINLLQQEIAPSIAQCYSNRRQLEQSRNLLDRFVVGNAIFESVELTNAACASATTENCFPVLVTLAIYLKDDEADSALIAHILDVFSESWEFPIPFKSIQLTGARLYRIGDEWGHTPAPTYEEDEHEDEHSR